jgi:hypothetical protein
VEGLTYEKSPESSSQVQLYSVKYQLEGKVDVGTAVVLVGVVVIVVVLAQLAHERLVPQSSPTIEHIIVVMVDRQMLPSVVKIGSVVAGSLVIVGSIGRSVDRVDTVIVEYSTASCSVPGSRVRHRYFSFL